MMLIKAARENPSSRCFLMAHPPPPPPDLYLSRREKIRHQLGEENLDAALITSVVNVSYLTGFSGDSRHR